MVIIAYWAKHHKNSKSIEMCGVFANCYAFARFKQVEENRGWTVSDAVVLFEDNSISVEEWLEEQRKAGHW